jgi:hypothetical protein
MWDVLAEGTCWSRERAAFAVVVFDAEPVPAI